MVVTRWVAPWAPLHAALVLLCAGGEAWAHPVLVDRIEGHLGASTLELQVRTTLRTPLVITRAADDAALKVARAPAIKAALDASGYVASHLSVRVGGAPLVASVGSTSIVEPSAASAAGFVVEETYVQYNISYALPEGDPELDIALTTSMLSEFEAAPLQSWDQSFAVVLWADASRSASGVLRSGRPLLLKLPRAAPPKAALNPWLRSAPKLAVIAVAAVMLLASARRVARRRFRRQ